MKKMSVWKVILLTTITLGIYSVYWAAVQRANTSAHYKELKKTPHWLWLLIPFVGAQVFGAIISIVLVSMALVTDGDLDAYVTAMICIILICTLIPIIIYIWWFAIFGKAIEHITHGRMSTGWTIVLAIFAGPYVIAFHQYYINRLPVDGSSKTKQRPTGKFVLVALLVIVVSTALGVLSLQDTPNQHNRLVQDLQEARDQVNNAIESGSLETRATNALYGHAYRPEIFRTDQIVAADEEYAGFNGDGTMEVTYKLSDKDFKKLMSDKVLIDCGDLNNCSVDTSEPNSEGRCASGFAQEREIDFHLCLNPSDNTVEWRYGWY